MRFEDLIARPPAEAFLMAAPAAEWILDQTALSLQQLAATFPYVDEAELKEVVRSLEHMKVILAYEPGR